MLISVKCLFYTFGGGPGGGAVAGVYIFLFDQYGQITCRGERMIERKNKRGEVAYYDIFPHLVKSMHIFSPIDLKYTKKRAENISPEARTPPRYNKYHLGKNLKGGGGI